MRFRRLTARSRATCAKARQHSSPWRAWCPAGRTNPRRAPLQWCWWWTRTEGGLHKFREGDAAAHFGCLLYMPGRAPASAPAAGSMLAPCPASWRRKSARCSAGAWSAPSEQRRCNSMHLVRKTVRLLCCRLMTCLGKPVLGTAFSAECVEKVTPGSSEVPRSKEDCSPTSCLAPAGPAASRAWARSKGLLLLGI